jgi:DNA replication and repair protein RecF
MYDKFSDHIGFIPLVIISPADRDLIVEGSETRRKFIDSVISQLDSLSATTHPIPENPRTTQCIAQVFALNQTFETETLSI